MSQTVKQLKAQISQTSGQEQLRLRVELAFALREVDARDGVNVSRAAIDIAQAESNWGALTSLRTAEALNLDRLGEYAAALQSLDEAQRINARTGDLHALARIWNVRGLTCSNQGHFPDALRYFLLSEGVCEEIRNSWVHCSVVNNIGVAYDRMGRHHEAFSAFQRALKLACSVSREDIELHAISNMGSNRMDLKLWDESLHYHKEALHSARRQENTYSIIVCTANMAESYARLGKTELAHTLFREATATARQVGDLEHLVDVLHEHARLYLNSGDRPAALALMQECVTLLEKMGGFYRELRYRVQLADMLVQDGRPGEALAGLEAALPPSEHDGTLEARQQLYGLLSRLHAGAGRRDLSQNYERTRRDVEKTLQARQDAWASLVPEIERQVGQWKQDAALTGRRLLDTFPDRAASPPEALDLAGLDAYFDAAHRHFQDLALLVVSAQSQDGAEVDLNGLLDDLPDGGAVKAVRLGQRPDGTAVLLLPDMAHQDAVAFSRDLVTHLRAGQVPRISVGCCTTTAWSHSGDMLRSAERLHRQAQGLGGNRVMATGQGGA